MIEWFLVPIVAPLVVLFLWEFFFKDLELLLFFRSLVWKVGLTLIGAVLLSYPFLLWKFLPEVRTGMESSYETAYQEVLEDWATSLRHTEKENREVFDKTLGPGMKSAQWSTLWVVLEWAGKIGLVVIFFEVIYWIGAYMEKRRKEKEEGPKNPAPDESKPKPKLVVKKAVRKPVNLTKKEEDQPLGFQLVERDLEAKKRFWLSKLGKGEEAESKKDESENIPPKGIAGLVYNFFFSFYGEKSSDKDKT